MDVEDVDRAQAVELGLIDRDTEIFPQSRDFNSDLSATPKVRADALRMALAEALQGIAEWGANGVLKLITGGAS